jgi:ankyrin repeat protein
LTGALGELDDALFEAAARGDVARIAAAIAQGAPLEAHDGWGWTPLIHAARAGHTAAVEALLAAGADPWHEDAAPLRTGGGLFPLLHADAGDHVETAVVLGRAMRGRPPSARRQAWLTAALSQAADGHPAWALGLLAAGAEPRGHPPDGFPLIMAVQSNEPAIVQALLAAGADPEQPFADTTPLVKAVRSRDVELVRLLLAAGARPDQPAPDGTTPLQAAQQPGRLTATEDERRTVVTLLTAALSR